MPERRDNDFGNAWRLPGDRDGKGVFGSSTGVRQVTERCINSPILGMVAFLQRPNRKGKHMLRSISQLGKRMLSAKRQGQPPAEEDFGGGDICSLQEQPSTDDDEPLE